MRFWPDAAPRGQNAAMLNSLPRGGGPATRERIVMLTDAVVAIAMTLLVLPVVDVVPDIDMDRVGEFLTTHPSLLLGYALSFLVIYLFWSAHRVVYEALDVVGQSSRALNLLWLLGVAFLPFPTALIGREPTSSTAPIYISTVLFVCVLTAAMTQIAAHQSVDGRLGDFLNRRALGLWAASVVLLGCAVISSVHPDAGLYGLLAMIPIRAVSHTGAGRQPG